MFGSCDFLGISLAHGRDMRAVIDPALQERDLAVEFGAVDVEGLIRNAQQPHALRMV